MTYAILWKSSTKSVKSYNLLKKHVKRTPNLHTYIAPEKKATKGVITSKTNATKGAKISSHLLLSIYCSWKQQLNAPNLSLFIPNGQPQKAPHLLSQEASTKRWQIILIGNKKKKNPQKFHPLTYIFWIQQ